MQKSLHIQGLYNHIYVEILSYLAPKDFLNLASTSRFFSKLLSDGSTWKAYIAKSGPEAIISCANVQVQPAQFYDFVKFAMKIFYSKPDNVITLNPYNGPLQLTPVEASSTDFNQSIDKVLSKKPSLFWSSTGSPSEDSEEHLIFLFSKYLVVPTSVLVTFFTAAGFYEEGTFEFPSKRLQVEFSFDGNNWEYRSDIFEVNGKHEIEVKMKGKVGIARYMKVNLIGKTVKQPTDDLYYNAIQSIKASGYQLNSSVTDHNSMNELLLKSWITWKSERIMSDATTEEQASRSKEIVDYYASQTYSSDTYIKFLELLNSKDNDAIWDYLEVNKYLLSMEMTFLDIFRNYKEFGLYYFKRIIQEKKRYILNSNETLLLFLIFVEANNDAVFHHVIEVISGKYQLPILTSILYLAVSANTLTKLREIMGVGNEEGVNFLKNSKKIISAEPTDYSTEEASIILFYYISISKLLSERTGPVPVHTQK